MKYLRELTQHVLAGALLVLVPWFVAHYPSTQYLEAQIATEPFGTWEIIHVTAINRTNFKLNVIFNGQLSKGKLKHAIVEEEHRELTPGGEPIWRGTLVPGQPVHLKLIVEKGALAKELTEEFIATFCKPREDGGCDTARVPPREMAEAAIDRYWFFGGLLVALLVLVVVLLLLRVLWQRSARPNSGGSPDDIHNQPV